jgi:hypothetical protein
MTPFEILFAGGAAAAVLAIAYLALSKRAAESATVAATVLGGLVGFTAVTIAFEGPIGFLPNHTASLWGNQVWYDLVISLCVALLFVAPRARAVGMKVPAYVLATGLLGSIGLLAMVARLFWLEKRAAA